MTDLPEPWEVKERDVLKQIRQVLKQLDQVIHYVHPIALFRNRHLTKLINYLLHMRAEVDALLDGLEQTGGQGPGGQ